jgi:AhpD family alkylhydroperoxidase
VEGLSKLEGYVRKSGLEHSLLELVKLRASQLNGCAYCIDMHTKDARTNGESEQRLYGVSAWHEAPFYTDRERAALAWTEAVTLISQDHVPDEIYAEARKHFSEKELVDLTSGNHRHQQLESARRQFPHAGGIVPARPSSREKGRFAQIED